MGDLLRVDYLLVGSPDGGGGGGIGSVDGGNDNNQGVGFELVLGEMTPYPGGGFFKWNPISFDADLASRYREGAASATRSELSQFKQGEAGLTDPRQRPQFQLRGGGR